MGILSMGVSDSSTLERGRLILTWTAIGENALNWFTTLQGFGFAQSFARGIQ